MKLIRLHTFSSKASPPTQAVATQAAATHVPATPRPRGWLRRVAAATALLVAAAWIAAARPGAMLVFGFLALGVAIPFTTDIDREQAITMVLAARGVSGFTSFREQMSHAAPLRRNIEQSEVGDVALFLCSNGARAITGEIMFVDAGYNIMGA